VWVLILSLSCIDESCLILRTLTIISMSVILLFTFVYLEWFISFITVWRPWYWACLIVLFLPAGGFTSYMRLSEVS